jgi:uncharacterized surface protein with fasciclin (FAS1) repeats
MPSSIRSTAAAIALIAGFAAAGAASAQGAAQPAPAAPAAPAAAPAATFNLTPAGDIVQTLQANGHFKTFIKALDATNLTPVLKSPRNLTVFAPTDEAFAALPAGEVDKMFANASGLQHEMIHMIINAPIDSSKFKNAKGPVPSVAGDNILLDGSSEDGKLKADNAAIIQADVHVSNGIIHVVDAVMTPQPAPAAPAAASSGQAAAASAAAPKS